MHQRFTAWAAVFAITLAAAAQVAPPVPPRAPAAPEGPDMATLALSDLNVSPFEAVEWENGGGLSRVKVAGTWFELIEINGWNIRELLRFARERYADKAQRRFEEDLPQLLIDADRRPSSRATLRLRTLDDQQELFVDVPMSKENRRALLEARQVRERAADPPGRRKAAPFVEDAQAGATALRQFRDLIATRHAYSIATPEGARLRARVDGVLNRPEPVTLALAKLTIERALGVSRDGHAGVRAIDGVGPGEMERFAPCLFVPLGDEPGTPVVALRPDRSGLLDPQCPYVTAVNAVHLEERLMRASECVADASPALVRERSCRELRSLGVIADNSVTVTLTNVAVPQQGGADEKIVAWTSEAASSPPRYATWPRRESGRINDSVGYLRIAEMSDDPATLNRIEDLIASFDKASAIIIDVRGNGGGSRDALMLLASRFMPPCSPPIVFNAARPLKLGQAPEAVDRRMDSRFLRRADDPRWTESQRTALASFIERFKRDAPDVNLDPPTGDFGPWYYGLLAPDPDVSWHRPDRPVLVLMDNVCFSATDVFLAAMKQIDGVTLIGRPSAGGSGMAISYPLAGGAITVSLSSMVSFQPDGRLFDGVGVQPDVHVTPAPTDFITGGTDTVLDRALAELERIPKHR